MRVERGAGDVRVDVFGSQVLRNGKFDPADLDDGFDIDEYDAGSVVGIVASTTASDNYEEGLDFDENAAGDLAAILADSTSTGNGDVDLRADQQTPGAGSFAVTHVTYATTGGNVSPAAP